jgi:acetoin utilization protein AcuB
MSKPVPAVMKYMTTSPHTIGRDQTLAHARDLFREYRIRHPPVRHGGKLVGLLSDRDVALIEALPDVDPHAVQVADAMSDQVFVVSPQAGLDEVAAEMASRKFGSAVVVDNNKVVGVFTTVDGMAALNELLKTRLAN